MYRGYERKKLTHIEEKAKRTSVTLIKDHLYCLQQYGALFQEF